MGESAFTVVCAMLANIGICGAKLAAFIITGSAAMGAEFVHSLADSINEVLLFIALKRSEKQADRKHAFGYGKEKYFWTLVVACSIFGMGALFAFQEGYDGLVEESKDKPNYLIAWIVLGVSILLEGFSWLISCRDLGKSAKQHGMPFTKYMWRTDDPTVTSVLLEDTAALLGLVIAAIGIAIHEFADQPKADAIASILIGVVLTAVAFFLGAANKNLLIGSQAQDSLLGKLEDFLNRCPEVESLVDMQTMVLGTDRVLLCARLDFDDKLSAHDLELATVRITEELIEAHKEVFEVFLEPVPRTDPNLRKKVLQRYRRASGSFTPEFINRRVTEPEEV